MVRALASHQCGPGSIPGLGVICGLSLLLVVVPAPRGFSPDTPVFPPSSKTNIPKFQFGSKSEGHRFVSCNRLLKLIYFIFLLNDAALVGHWCFYRYFQSSYLGSCYVAVQEISQVRQQNISGEQKNNKTEKL